MEDVYMYIYTTIYIIYSIYRSCRISNYYFSMYFIALEESNKIHTEGKINIQVTSPYKKQYDMCINVVYAVSYNVYHVSLLCT